MTSFVRGAECERCRITRVVLNSEVADPGSTRQKGSITTEVLSSIITLNVHQIVVPIIGTNNFARLSLECSGKSLNGFSDGLNKSYCVGVPLIREYLNDAVGIYKWPSDMFPIYESRKPYPPLGGRWNYEWTRNDGTPYPLGATDHWIAEFFAVQKCHEHVDEF